MSRLIVVSPKGEFFERPMDENYKHAEALKEFLVEQGITYNEDINNGHKLCLDLSRDGYWIFRASDNTSMMYIGKDITPEQFVWYSNNIEYINQLNVISVASWEDPEFETGGYDVIEEGSVGVNSIRETINDLIIEKSKNLEKPKKSRFGFFRRTK